jgi:hypothetical protein
MARVRNPRKVLALLVLSAATMFVLLTPSVAQAKCDTGECSYAGECYGHGACRDGTHQLCWNGGWSTDKVSCP